MTRLFLISALCSCFLLRGHAQPIAEWIEQLSALQALHSTVQQGYGIVTDGLQTIGDTRHQEFELHSNFFGSLDKVKTAIDGDPRVQALRSRLGALGAQLRAALDYWQRQPILSP